MSTPIPILYTDTAAIRATIGCDTDDLPDEILVNQNLDLQMAERLSEIQPNYEDYFDSSDDAERQLILWCQYFGALAILESGLLAIPDKYQANNDQASRLTLKFEPMIAALKAKIARLEQKITDPSLAVSRRPILFSSVPPRYDPITGA